MTTDIKNEDRLVQQTFAAHLEQALGWESVYAYNTETFGPNSTLGRVSERDVVLVRALRATLERLNRDLPASAREQAIEKLTRIDFARSVVNDFGECHGVQGLLVADMSVFPTSLGAPPQITTAALADRTAHHILERWSELAG